MEKAYREKTVTPLLTTLCLSLVGCGVITLFSLIKVSCYPVPFTLQTLAIFILALTQSPKQAFFSVLCYLFCGTLGLPVFCGQTNMGWMIGKCGGYYIGFLLAAYLIAFLRKFIPSFLAIVCGQLVIYTLGFFWLIPFFGISIAFHQGVVIFLPSALLKAAAATGFEIIWRKK